MDKIVNAIEASIAVKKKLLEDRSVLSKIGEISDEIVLAFQGGGKVLLCGNGGSAADAQHLAAEFSGRFYFDRAPLDAEALHVNTSYLTAVGNDYSFDEVFSRLVRAKGRKGDILIGLSTSGNSKNVLKAVEAGSDLGLVTIGLIGGKPSAMDTICKHVIKVPSADTPRIQEAHILIGHIICEVVEKKLFGIGE